MVSIIPKFSVLSPSIIRILGCNPGPMTLQGTNTYLIGTGKKRVLLDTGEADNKEYVSLLKSSLEQRQIKLDTIIISHWHHDHVGGLPGVLSAIEDHVPVIIKFPRNENVEPDCLQRCTVKEAKDKDIIKVEGATLQLHHTPGHTTDHLVVKLVEDNVLFSGDCVLGEGTAVFEDLHTYMKSLQKILDMKPEKIYPGHGPVIDNPLERVSYYVQHRNQREAQIVEVLQNNPTVTYTPMQLVKIIYKDTPEHLHPAAASNVSHHLTKLWKEQRLEKLDGDHWGLMKPSVNKL